MKRFLAERNLGFLIVQFINSTVTSRFRFSISLVQVKALTPLTENNYWADNSYYSDLEVTIYGQ